jgi:hypothetical protein
VKPEVERAVRGWNERAFLVVVGFVIGMGVAASLRWQLMPDRPALPRSLVVPSHVVNDAYAYSSCRSTGGSVECEIYHQALPVEWKSAGSHFLVNGNIQLGDATGSAP